MGQGTSSNFWTPGNDGVRITVVDASSGTAVSSPLDFSNRTQKTSLLHFGKVNKLQYLSGTGLSLQSGAAYSCIKPAQSMPTIVSSKGQSNIEAIKRYFCSEYACMMVAQAARVDYERMIAGEYKLLIEPIAYFTHNGQYYCMTATEAGLYDQMSGGNLRKTMTSLTHKNLPLSMFLEFSDLGISAWTGNTTGKQNNSDIISTLGVGIFPRRLLQPGTKKQRPALWESQQVTVSGRHRTLPPVWRGILLHQTSAVYAHHRQQQGAEQY